MSDTEAPKNSLRNELAIGSHIEPRVQTDAALENRVTDGASLEGERELLASIKRGDAKAYERLVRDMTPRMLAVARRFFPDESDAFDAIQDAFLSAYKAIDRFEGDSRISTWLHRITVNACLMKLRSRRRRPEVSIDALQPLYKDDGHPTEFASPWNVGPSAGIEAKETAAFVRATINRLPDDARAVILLRDIEGFDTATSARMLEITEASVKTRLHRARLALRTLLDPFMKGLSNDDALSLN